MISKTYMDFWNLIQVKKKSYLEIIMKIGIVGAGASGLFAAITAAKQGADVTLIEKKDRICKKLLATGNGKCNFTNKSMSKIDFRSQKGDIFNDYIGQFDEKEVISFFESMGMLIKERNGYCYPRSEQASTVLDLLRLQIKNLNIPVISEHYPINIRKCKKNFEIILNNNQKFYFDRIILACGSFAGEKKRDDFNGYAYAEDLGHTIIPVVPALVQVRVKSKDFKSISGVRCDANISLYINRKPVTEEFGELQITDYGISGIPVFQLSRYVSYGIHEKKNVTAVIDLLPEYTKEEWLAFVKEKWSHSPKTITAEEFFQGFLNKKLNLFFLKTVGIKADTPLKQINYSKIEEAVRRMKSWEMEIEGTNPYENAQVCAGGVSMDEITLHMESKIVPGLYFAGELLDVDGRCGGYNLQWAWTSGYLAGKFSSGNSQ